MSEPIVIGMDVGATKILVGAVTQAGDILAARRFKVDSETQATTLRSIETSLENFIRDWIGSPPLAIGIGLVGQTNPKAGTWFEAINLPITTPIPLAGQLSERYKVPVTLDNDVHAAALAELRWGIGKESKDFIYLNVGTGIAAGLVFNGQLLRGTQNYAGELGHMVVQPDGPLCPCGRPGCVEPIASGGGMLARVQELLADFPDSMLHAHAQSEPLTTHSIFTAADTGDPLAIKISSEAIQALSIALINLVNLLNPEWIVYGGGTLSDGWLIEHVRVDVESRPLLMTRKSLKGILPSRLNPDQVGLLGAACLAWNINPSGGANAIHPMLTNILALANPATWQRSIDLADEALTGWLKTPRSFKRIYLVGHGSSFYNCQVGEYILEHIAGIPSKATPAFAFSAYKEQAMLDAQTLVIGISTTGETQSTYEALERARQAGSSTLAITAHNGSPITHNVDAIILTGGEDDQISVKTKSYVQALIPIYLLALHLVGDATLKSYWLDQINLAAQGAHQFLQEQWCQIKQLAENYAKAPKVFVLGTGPNLGTAEEASLKIIEMAKMYSECQELEDFMHGRLREVDQNSPLFFIAPQGQASHRVLDFLTVTDMIQAPSIVLTDNVSSGIQRLATHVIQIPASLDEFATPLLYVLPMHVFGYEMALQRGYDPTARRYNIVPQDVRYEGEE